MILVIGKYQYLLSCIIICLFLTIDFLSLYDCLLSYPLLSLCSYLTSNDNGDSELSILLSVLNADIRDNDVLSKHNLFSL